ncbi:MAG: hypothetical protein AB1458_07165 [Bacteroidota bacterium]
MENMLYMILTMIFTKLVEDNLPNLSVKNIFKMIAKAILRMLPALVILCSSAMVTGIHYVILYTALALSACVAIVPLKPRRITLMEAY